MRLYLFILSTAFFLISCDESKESCNSKEIVLETSDSTKLYAKISGQGPYCLFIHGGPGAWSKSFEVLKGNELEKHYSMIYLDQRGSGRSENAENYSLDRILLDIEELRKELGIDKWSILSHSFGGIIAFNYARQYPEYIESLIFANATLNFMASISDQGKYVDSLLGKSQDSIDKDSILPHFFTSKQRLHQQGLAYKTLTDKPESFKLVDSIDQTSPSTYDFAKNIWNYSEYLEDYSKMTQQIKAPVLVITGSQDHAIGIHHYKSFNFPNSTTSIINGGHLLYFENNKEFVKAIKDFKANLH